MKKYVCDVCGYIYDEEIGDPDNGVEAGTKWEDVPEDFLCPLCGVGKDEFSEVDVIINGRDIKTRKGGSRKVIPGERSFFLCCRVYVK